MKDFSSMPEFDDHALIQPMRDEAKGLVAFVCIHRQNGAVPSFGATRMWRYTSEDDALRDAMRLSRVMSYKAALAGLPCGGGKAVIMEPPGDLRRKALESYADHLRPLSERFVTGTDVGISQEDLVVLKAHTPNIVGFNDNSTFFTVLGLYHAIRCTLREAIQDDDIHGKRFAIQGLGKIGSGLLERLYPEASTVYVADVDPERVREIAKKYPKVVPVVPEEIHKQPVDLFSPCALGSVLNENTVPELRCAAVAGGANDQLANDVAGDMLQENHIIYAPDYIVNAGGLIAVFDEYEHEIYDEARVREKVMMIEERLGDVLSESAIDDISPHRIAKRTAEDAFSGYLPQLV
jgi:leucine dehydrogenase